MEPTQTGVGELLDGAVEALTNRLPSSWTVEKQPSAGDPVGADLVVKSPNAGSQMPFSSR